MLYTEPSWMKRLFQLAAMDMAILCGKMLGLKKTCYTWLVLSRKSLRMKIQEVILFILSLSINVPNAPIWNFTTKFNALCQLQKFLKLDRVSWINMEKPEMVLEVETWKLV